MHFFDICVKDRHKSNTDSSVTLIYFLKNKLLDHLYYELDKTLLCTEFNIIARYCIDFINIVFFVDLPPSKLSKFYYCYQNVQENL